MTMERPGVMLVVPLLLLLLVVGEVELQRARQRLVGVLLQPLVPVPAVLAHPMVPPPGFLVPGPFPEPVSRRRLGPGGRRQTVQNGGFVQTAKPTQQGNFIQRQPSPTQQGGSVQQPSPTQQDEVPSRPVEGGSQVPRVPQTPAPAPAPAQHAPSPSGQRHYLCGVMPSPGECRAAFPRYYFNKTTNQCDCFLYGGCGNEGLQSSYRSLDDCHQKCHPENTEEGPTCSDIFREQQTYFGDDPVPPPPQRQQQQQGQQQRRGTVGGVPFPDTSHLSEKELLDLFTNSKSNTDYDKQFWVV